ncbi:zinc finger protein ZAT11-like [Hevea brasiliensis]|nr:zinc finger protein ZAT11-like [Hevea brasiliensis]
MAMKRTRDNDGDIESLDMAKCLILLSHTLQNNNPRKPFKTHDDDSHLFECKTCNRKFPSFQALGGHRASHKKPRLMGENNNNNYNNKPRSVKLLTSLESSAGKPKMHQCSICGMEFALGQALGGHMRRHRAAMTQGFSFAHDHRVVSKLPVLRRSNSIKRVFGMDLNLTPLENDLEYLFGKMAPKVDPLI